MKSRLLLTTALAAFAASMPPARADSFDDYVTSIQKANGALPQGIPADTSTAMNDLTAAQRSLKESQQRAVQSQAELSSAQANVVAVNSGSATKSYEAKAVEVAVQLERMDTLQRIYKSDDAKRNLDAAVTNQKTAEYWLGASSQAVQQTRDLPDSDRRKQEAVAGFANAQKQMGLAQYAAEVAADQMKDPKNGLVPLQKAQAEYNALKSQLDTLNAEKNTAIGNANAKLSQANAALKQASTDVQTGQVAVAVKGQAALKAVANAQAVGIAIQISQAVVIKTAVDSQGPALAPGTSGPLAAGGTPGVGVGPGSGVVAQGAGNVVAQGAGNLVAQGAGNLVAQGAGNVVAQGAGNVVAQGAGNVVAQGAGNLVAQGAGNLVAQGAGNVVAQGAGNLVAQGAGNLVAQGAGNVVAQGAGNLIAPDGASLVAQGAGNLVAQGAGNFGILALAAPAVTSGTGFAMTSEITAFSATDLPTDKLKRAINDLPPAEAKTLVTLAKIVDSGGKLTPEQSTQADALLGKAIKKLDPGVVNQLQTQAGVKAAQIEAKQVGTAVILQTALENAKTNPAVISAALKLAEGKPLNAAETAQVTKAVATVVGKMPGTAAEKQAAAQNANTQITSAAPNLGVVIGPSTQTAEQRANVAREQTAALTTMTSNLTEARTMIDNRVRTVDAGKAKVDALNKQIAAEKDPTRRAGLTTSLNSVKTELAMNNTYLMMDRNMVGAMEKEIGSLKTTLAITTPATVAKPAASTASTPSPASAPPAATPAAAIKPVPGNPALAPAVKPQIATAPATTPPAVTVAPKPAAPAATASPAKPSTPAAPAKPNTSPPQMKTQVMPQAPKPVVNAAPAKPVTQAPQMRTQVMPQPPKPVVNAAPAKPVTQAPQMRTQVMPQPPKPVAPILVQQKRPEPPKPPVLPQQVRPR